jgi:hypothetical protein
MAFSDFLRIFAHKNQYEEVFSNGAGRYVPCDGWQWQGE